MNKHPNSDRHVTRRHNEKGAALITVLLISTLLLSAGLALVLSSSLSATTAIDATAEMQAYFAAEAGLEATLNVLRGNVAPDASLATTKMSFRNAADPATSNKTSDSLRSGTNAVSRLSGWFNYSYQNPNLVSDWRVPLTSSYAPFTGIAYRITITDPDDPGDLATRKITTDSNYVPTRLLVQSEGYGPKGAIKRLEMVLRSGALDISAPAAISLPGGSSVNLSLGDSSVVTYSGTDHATHPSSGVAAVAVASGNVSIAQGVINGLSGSSGSTAPSPCPSGSQVTPCAAAALTASNTPSFLQSADAARAFLIKMRKLASDNGRLFTSQAQADAAGGLGTTTDAKFTFIDNYGTSSMPGTPVDLGANHQGSGLLIVTGELDTHGNTDFEGLILVLGRGIMDRSGGGNGVLRGAIMVANFDPNGAAGTLFGTPSFSINGGGNSEVNYDSGWVRRAMDLSGASVIGVREYH